MLRFRRHGNPSHSMLKLVPLQALLLRSQVLEGSHHKASKPATSARAPTPYVPLTPVGWAPERTVTSLTPV